MVPLLQNHRSDAIQFSGREAMIYTEGNGREPKLTDHPFTLDMDVRRFLTVKAVKEHAVGAWDIGHRGHARHLIQRSGIRPMCCTVYTCSL
jgi:hypothetical protein